MKKLILSVALLVQTFVGFSQTKPKPEPILAQVKNENVKMYQQPGTSSEVLQSLKRTDEVLILRRENTYWSLVTVNGKPGYILHIELINHPSTLLAVSTKKRKPDNE